MFTRISSMSQISNQSTPLSNQKAKTKGTIQKAKGTVQKAKGTGQKNARAVKGKKQAEAQPNQGNQVMDDFEAIEEFFKVLDDDTEPPVNQRKKKGGGKNKEDDSGIDPTIVTDRKAITIMEPTTMMTSGFQSLDLNDDLEGFGTESGMDFQKIFLESDEVFHSQNEIIENTSNLLNNKRPASHTPRRSSKRRRLTYDPIEDVNKSLQRDSQAPQADYEVPELENNFQENIPSLQASSLGYALNDQEMPDVMPQQTEEIAMQEIPQIEDITMQEIPEIPQMDQLEAAEISQMPQNPEIAEISQQIDQTNEAVHINADVQPSELILSDIHELPKKRTKKRKLIVDKEIYYGKKVVEKNFDEYVDKHTTMPPRDDFPKRWNELKSNAAVLFASPSCRLKHSKDLRDLFDRNWKKVQSRSVKKT